MEIQNRELKAYRRRAGIDGDSHMYVHYETEHGHQPNVGQMEGPLESAEASCMARGVRNQDMIQKN